jgi:hypothetical protein
MTVLAPRPLPSNAVLNGAQIAHRRMGGEQLTSTASATRSGKKE